MVFNGATITENTSGDRGAGVYYNEIVKLWLSGANIIQGNTYNDKLNNLNIYKADDTVYPVYVDGDLTGSQIGLSDPKLWDDGLSDDDDEAISENYLTYGFKENNNIQPSVAFTSDHESWSVDFSDVATNEVRLVRKKPDYHINNEDIDDNYDNNDIFTHYVEQAINKDVKVGDTIERFYTVPEVVPTAANSCPYIFKGWYYDPENDNDSHPVKFGTDKYAKDIYAHWIKVDNVKKDADDPTMFQNGGEIYGGFDLAGVQIRKEMRDYNFDDVPKKPGGMRFITSLSMDVVKQINAIQPNNIEYGYVAATHEGWIEYHSEGVAQGLDEKLKYVSDKANGINTTKTTEKGEDYFGFAHNVNCTSRQTNKNGIVRLDHQNFGNYLLYSFVVTYEGEDAARKDTNVLARPYIHYTDANGLERVAYSEYTGVSNVLGGCYTNYNTVAAKAGN